MRNIVGAGAEVSRVNMDLQEVQETVDITNLRMRGPQNYGEAARLSLQLKYQWFATECSNGKFPNIALQAGLTMMDSAWFQVARQGLPGITVKQEFADGKLDDGAILKNTTAPFLACEAAKLFRDCRVVWVETAATIERDPAYSDRFLVKYRQSEAECFIPATPQGNGWAYDACCCPDPIAYARFKGRYNEADDLARIMDRKWELPLEAAQRGLMVTFAELEQRGEKAHFSPRAALFKQFTADAERQSWPR